MALCAVGIDGHSACHAATSWATRMPAGTCKITCIICITFATPERASRRPCGACMQGWRWEGEDWHIDMAGQDIAAVDSEGWSYAVDFGWLHHPPVAGAGRFKRVSWRKLQLHWHSIKAGRQHLKGQCSCSCLPAVSVCDPVCAESACRCIKTARAQYKGLDKGLHLQLEDCSIVF